MPHLLQRLALRTAAILLALMSPSGSIAGAQTVREDLWLPNNTVSALTVSGHTLYLGGDFTRIGPVTGCGVPIDAATGVPAQVFPKIPGEVTAAVADGAGGWFVGGSFTSVGGLPRNHLAHILADHSVAAWDPGVAGTIHALALRGRTLLVGGVFRQAGGQPRSYLAAIDVATAEATRWDPKVNGEVFAIAVDANRVFVGGNFTHVGDSTRIGLAAIRPISGLADRWYPATIQFSYGSDVYGLALSGNTLYMMGTFSVVGGQWRNQLAALDATTGSLKDWDPEIGGYPY